MPQIKILLTGASGFVGTHVVACLQDKYELHAISHQAKKINGISTLYTWESIETISDSYFAVIHLAGLAHDTQNKRVEADYFEVNVGLTKKLLAQLDKWNVTTFIYLSSVKAVTDSTSSTLITEETKSTANNVYGRSKLAAEQSIMASSASANKIVLRPVLIYGPGQKGNLNALERLIHKGLWFPFKNWNNKRSVLSVHNLTSIIQVLLKKSIPSGVYFIADDTPVSTVDILNAIGSGSNQNVRFIPIPNGLISFGLSVLPRRLRSFTDKIFGSLEVDNNKLKTALGISTMPNDTSIDLPRSFKKLSNNLKT